MTVVVNIGQVAMAQSVAHSLASNKKTSLMSDSKSRDKHTSKNGVAISSGESQVLTSILAICLLLSFSLYHIKKKASVQIASVSEVDISVKNFKKNWLWH